VKVHKEDGQALVLALGFLIFVGLVIGAMLTFAYANELSTQRLGDQRNTAYASDGAPDAAIQLGLVATTVGRYGDGRCQAGLPSSAMPPTPILLATTSNNTAANVVCTWSSDALNVDRSVTFTTFVAGQATPIVRAGVIYHFHLSGPVTVEVTSWTYCTHGPPNNPTVLCPPS
jgi:hypothetical protein